MCYSCVEKVVHHIPACTFAAEFGRILRTMQEMTQSTPGMIEVSTNEDISRNYQVRAFGADADPFDNNPDLDNISLQPKLLCTILPLSYFHFQFGR